MVEPFGATVLLFQCVAVWRSLWLIGCLCKAGGAAGVFTFLVLVKLWHGFSLNDPGAERWYC